MTNTALPTTRLGDTVTQKDDVKGFSDVYWQKPFHPQALYLPMLQGGAPLKRGYIYQDPLDPATKDNPKGLPWGLNFLYNPTDVSVSYSLSTSIFPNSKDIVNTTIVGVPGAATVSWNLIMDRTFDVNADPDHPGIMEDIRHWEHMVGFSPERPFVQPVSMRVRFGHEPSFYGYIQSFAVLYSQWTQDMRPYRGGLTGVTLQILSTSKKKHATFHVGSAVARAANGARSGKDNTGRGGKK